MITTDLTDHLLANRLKSLNKHQRFLNHTFALAMDYGRSKYFPYAPHHPNELIDDQVAESFDYHLSDWQQWIYAEHLHSVYAMTCLDQKETMLKALHRVALGKMKLPSSLDVGLSIHISDYQLEQGHLTDRSCAHALALLEITCTMHTKYFSLGEVLFDELNQSVYLKRYLQEQSDLCKKQGGRSSLKSLILSNLNLLDILLKSLVHNKTPYYFWHQLMSPLLEVDSDGWGYVLDDEDDEDELFSEDQSNDKMANRLMGALDRFVNVLYEKIEIKSLVFGACDKDDDDDIVIDLRDKSDEILVYPWAIDFENDHRRKNKKSDSKPKFDQEYRPIKKSTTDVLGCYLHSQHIRLYAFKIEQSCQRTQLRLEQSERQNQFSIPSFTTKHVLLDIYLHELSHYFAHQARINHGKHWHWMGDSIRPIIEGIAQWFTYSVSLFLSDLANQGLLRYVGEIDMYQCMLRIHKYLSPKKPKVYYLHILWIKQYQPSAVIKGICHYISQDENLAKQHVLSAFGVAFHLYHFQAERLNGKKQLKASNVIPSIQPINLSLVYCPHLFNYGLSYIDDDLKVDSHYWISESLITRKLWLYVMLDKMRVLGVASNEAMTLSALRPKDSLQEIQIFCNRLSAFHGLTPYYEIDTQEINPSATGYRLPTRDEYLYARNSNCKTKYQSDFQRLDQGWFVENSKQKRMPIKKKKPNLWGIYDTYGLLYEPYVSTIKIGYFDVDHIEMKKAVYDPSQIFLTGGAYDLSVSESFKDDLSLSAFQASSPSKKCEFGFRVVRPIPIAQQINTHRLDFFV